MPQSQSNSIAVGKRLTTKAVKKKRKEKKRTTNPGWICQIKKRNLMILRDKIVSG